MRREDIETVAPVASSTVAAAGKHCEEEEGVSFAEVSFSDWRSKAQSADGQMTMADECEARRNARARVANGLNGWKVWGMS